MKKNLIISSILGMVALTSLPAQQPYRIWIECDTVGMIGDPFEIKLNAEGKDPQALQFPVLHGEFCPGLEIFPSDTIQTQTVNTGNGKQIRTDSYRFSAFQEGVFTIPPFSFTYTDHGLQIILQSDSTHIRIYEPTVDTTQAIKDIHGIVSVNGKELWKEYIHLYGKWVILLMVLTAMIIFLVYWWKRRKANLPVFKPVPPPVDPLKKAFGQLAALKDKQLWQKNLTKEYYTELTDILREYLSVEKNIPAIEMTNEELCAVLPSVLKENTVLYKDLAQTLNTATLAKFAKWDPSPDDNLNSYDSVLTFFNEQKRLRTEEKASATSEKEDIEHSPSKKEEKMSPSEGNKEEEAPIN